MATKGMNVVRPDVLSTVKVVWTKKGGFKVSTIKAVDTLPRELGIDVESNSALVGVKKSSSGGVTVVGLEKIIRRPGSVVAAGRCFGA